MIRNKRSYSMGVATSSIFHLPSNIFTTFIRHQGIWAFSAISSTKIALFTQIGNSFKKVLYGSVKNC